MIENAERRPVQKEPDDVRHIEEFLRAVVSFAASGNLVYRKRENKIEGRSVRERSDRLRIVRRKSVRH
ncbi:MAG: hypothetical protein P1V97_30805 [Planctomycetota bacterium]|nr:hypothetical protein [Planctomycetota bacterium]